MDRSHPAPFHALAPAVMLAIATTAGATPVHHGLSVRLDPPGQTIEVVDRVTVGDAVEPDREGAIAFLLHAGLEVEVVSDGWTLERGPDEVGGDPASCEVPRHEWRLRRGEKAVEPVELRYRGRIHHPLAEAGEEYQRGFSETPGIIGAEGVFLAGASAWVPSFGDQLVTFELEVQGLQPPWDVVSQGGRSRHELLADGTRVTAWTSSRPTEEVYLVAGPWHEYSEKAGDVELYAFLRSEDPALAERYLAATRRYLTMYQGLLPSFPFPAFSLVENFWETGYGMPGFTLLGPRVIRFPWILTSSYPHELLHNWWGNSAYVEAGSGNWCEGLTAYLADHLFAEQRGEAAVYRRATLKKYTDFVTSSRDFPLSEFTARRSAATEAVGYGKSLMLFHMLRRAVGDQAFADALSRFWTEHAWSRASFADVAAAFDDETGGDWTPFFATWTSRPGAPQLEIASVSVGRGESATEPWRLELELRQTQDADPFPVNVPVAVTLEDRAEAVWAEVGACERSCRVRIPCPARPLRVDVDPEFDVMRRLDPLEVPPALSTVFGAEAPFFVLPAAAPEAELAAWRELAAVWARPAEPRLVLDSEVEGLPEGSAWVLGWSNRLAGQVTAQLAAHRVSLGAGQVMIGDDPVAALGHSLVLVARSPHDPASAVAWVTADPVEAIPGLARKLPHYTRYSSLAFQGAEPENTAKGMWPPVGSPLVRNLADGALAELALPARPPLAELPPSLDPADLRRDVEVLAAPELEGRGLGSAGLARATAWVEARLAELGLEPAGDDGFRQRWTWRGGEPERDLELTNLIARAPGSDPELARRPVLIMAHLDHLGLGWPDVREGNAGLVHPGADDNASGVAALLALAQVLADEAPRPRPVLFGVTSGEEAGLLGARHLLDALGSDGAPYACLNLDTVGRLGGGQIHVLNADSAREWRHIFMGVGYTTGAPIAIVTEPLDASDQVACLERGIPAVQLFTGAHADYHRPTDTAESIDARGLVTVVEATHEAVAYLAERAEPLEVRVGAAAAGQEQPSGHATPRRAALGTVPDFGFAGPGVRVQGLIPGSAAEAVGIQPGDVITAIASQPVADLRAYSQLLKAHSPGDQVEVSLLRDGQERTVRAVLGER